MDFVIIANAWAAAQDNPTSKHQIALELLRQGHRVLWVEGAGMRSPNLGSGADRGRIVRKIGAASRGARRDAEASPWVLSPLLIPLPALAWARKLNAAIYRRSARKWSRRLSFVDPVMINYVPVLAGVMQPWPGRVVYHCVDRWDQFEMYDTRLMQEMDAACRGYADVVIASSKDLYIHCQSDHTNVHLINHGVSYEHFARALEPGDGPGHFAHHGKRVIGFFGLLSEWVDQALLIALARACDDAELVLIGSADVDVSALHAEPNITILGPRPFTDLPEYVAHFDVGIIPFVVNELTRAVNPIKLREMLAAGCPVVSTDLPEVERYGTVTDGAAQIACSHDDFITAVRRLLGETPDREAISETMKDETWRSKVDELIAVIMDRQESA